MLTIRSFTPDDEQEVIKLWKKVFPEAPAQNDPTKDIQIKLSVQSDLFLVALYDQMLVGTAMAGFDGHRGWIYYLAVDPDYRRKGIGTRLMKTVEEKLTNLGCPKLNLQIRADSHYVQAFYETIGYGVEDRISMGKKITRNR